MLNGELGEFVTIARKQRGSESWFVGSLTDEKPRDFDLALGFLAKRRTYVAEIYCDGKDADWRSNPYEHQMVKRLVTRDARLQLHLAPGGGAAIRFRPATAAEKTHFRASGSASGR